MVDPTQIEAPVTGCPEPSNGSHPQERDPRSKAGLCVHELVAQQAAGSPGAPAILSQSEGLTYGELNRRANRLARHLQLLGLGREKLAAIYMERSSWLVVAALAVLKAGGAYVPIDPQAPSERVRFMLHDAGVSVLLTSSTLTSRAPAGKWRVCEVDAEWTLSPAPSDGEIASEVSESDLAYVIYTSGSTGQPKGVEIPHAGLSNLVAWHRRAFAVTNADRASLQAALGFDASVWELWPYLASGATIRIAPESIRNSPELLRDWLVSQKITITFLSTALAESMLNLKWPPNTALRILLTGADALQQRPSSRLPFQLVNNYGPTECTVVVTSGRVESKESASGIPSIGRAIDGVSVHILDEGMRAVPEGTAGEIYVGGAGLARGYRNQPALTAQRFVHNPLSGERFYRTGDLARQLPNGEIEFLGRVDDQIKIRGYRVEPLEIVTALNSHPDVQSNVVIAREDQKGEKRLVAYVVPRANAALRAAELRRHVGSQLPDYMIPAVFLKVDSIPVTANGKADRAALPKPDESNILRDHEYVEPNSLVEKRLAEIAAPLLKVDRIGRTDNFFLLGGHSLLGTQLITRIQEAFGVELSLLSLFDHPTIAAMAGEIEKLIFAKLENGEEAPANLEEAS